jgi:hypothetical protein
MLHLKYLLRFEVGEGHHRQGIWRISVPSCGDMKCAVRCIVDLKWDCNAGFEKASFEDIKETQSVSGQRLCPVPHVHEASSFIFVSDWLIKDIY